jgi:hypothetical protein
MSSPQRNRKMDHTLGTLEPNMQPMHGLMGLTKPETPHPEHMPEDENFPNSVELHTPEYKGHERRIHNKPPRP